MYGTDDGAWMDLGAEDTRYELFERVYIGLYESQGPDRGAVRFFDVQDAPPRNGRPDSETTKSFEEVVGAITEEVQSRNRLAPKWVDVPDDAAEGD